MRSVWHRSERDMRRLVHDVVGGLDDDARLARARAFCARALDVHWRDSTRDEWPEPIHSCPVILKALPERLALLALECARDVAAVSKPIAAYYLSALYTSLLPDTMRSSLGVFFTPPAIVDRLLDLV